MVAAFLNALVSPSALLSVYFLVPAAELIGDDLLTPVQTSLLATLASVSTSVEVSVPLADGSPATTVPSSRLPASTAVRSEERRVGKECSDGLGPVQEMVKGWVAVAAEA